MIIPTFNVFRMSLFEKGAYSPEEIFVGFEWCNETLAKNIATMICSALQFFLYFPVDKILFHKKKEEK